jgi:mono/diheme cytochrome c family protein
MRLSNLFVVAVALAACATASAQKANPGDFGRPATPEDIAKLDYSINPVTGAELPPGKGTAKEGAPIFAAKCAVCHGPTAEESKLTYARLVGGIGSLTTDDPVITPGSTWPYATSIWDFIHRAMQEFPAGPNSLPPGYLYTQYPIPATNATQGAPSGGGGGPFEMKDGDLLKTGVNPLLTVDQIYALTAFVLWRNNIIKEDDVMDQNSLPKVQMPNRNGFIPVDPDGKVPTWKSRDPKVRIDPHVSPNSKPLPPNSKPVNTAP